MANAGQIQTNIDVHYRQCVIALQQIEQLADTGSNLHRSRFFSGEDGDGIANGWRVAEAMREIANDAVGGIELPRSLFCKGDRVRVKVGNDAGRYGTIIYVPGDDGSYYGVILDHSEKEFEYSECELENDKRDEPAWVSRFANGNANCSPFCVQEIATEVRKLLIYKAAMESMAEQFIHPKITAMDLAKSQLGLK